MPGKIGKGSHCNVMSAVSITCRYMMLRRDATYELYAHPCDNIVKKIYGKSFWQVQVLRDIMIQTPKSIILHTIFTIATNFQAVSALFSSSLFPFGTAKFSTIPVIDCSRINFTDVLFTIVEYLCSPVYWLIFYLRKNLCCIFSGLFVHFRNNRININVHPSFKYCHGNSIVYYICNSHLFYM